MRKKRKIFSTLAVISLLGTILEKSLKLLPLDFGWGSASDPAVGAYSALPDPLAGFKGPTSEGKEGKKRGKGVDIAWPDL